MRYGWTTAGVWLSVVLLAACSGACAEEDTPSTASSADVEPDTESESSGDEELAAEVGVTVHRCDSEAITLSEQAKAALVSVDFTQCAMPLGVLLAADAQFSVRYVEQAAQVLAELLDADRDGVADDAALVTELRKWDRAWLAMPFDDQSWETQQLPALQRVLGYDIIIPAWWIGNTSSAEPDSRAKAVMVEEIVHFITQFGWSTVYPDQFGVYGWSSVIAQETLRAACDWWQHPENDCPGSPAEYPGDCSDPSCDVVEFYQQVLVMRAGMEPGWLGIGFPENREVLEAKLSDTLKAVMDDPQYHQLGAPLRFDYPVVESL